MSERDDALKALELLIGCAHDRLGIPNAEAEAGLGLIRSAIDRAYPEGECTLRLFLFHEPDRVGADPQRNPGRLEWRWRLEQHWRDASGAACVRRVADAYADSKMHAIAAAQATARENDLGFIMVADVTVPDRIAKVGSIPPGDRAYPPEGDEDDDPVAWNFAKLDDAGPSMYVDPKTGAIRARGHWSKTPPSEPGLYFVRSVGVPRDTPPALVQIYPRGSACTAEIVGGRGERFIQPNADSEYWSERVQEPPA